MSEQTLGVTSMELSAASRDATIGLSRAWLSLLLALFALTWFASLGLRSLVHSDEGRYASLALEMARSGDWITPRLNGLLYFEKPALQYWIGALSFQWLGVSEFSARLWPGLAGFLSVLAVGYTAGRLWGQEAAVRAFAIAASTTLIVGNAHFLTLDAGLSLFLTLTLCAVLLAECLESSASVLRRWVWVGWVAMAGAVLSKGPVGLLIPVCVMAITGLWQRDAGLWRRMHVVSGGLIFLALVAPWFVMVSLRNPGFAEFFFIHEHIARYLGGAHHREGAWWYYLPLLLAGSLPWTSGLPWILRVQGSRARPAQTRAARLLVAWSAFVFLFFSASGSKLPSYILPMFPALALLLTMRLRHAKVGDLRRHLMVPTVFWILVMLASTQLHRLESVAAPAEVVGPLGSALRIGALLFLAGAISAWGCLGRRQMTAAVLSVALGHFAAVIVVMQAHDAFGRLKSAAPLAEALLPLIDKDTPVFAVRSYDQTLPFYLQRNIVLVDYADEFSFGQQQEPGKSIATLDEFGLRWQALPTAAAYMNRETWLELHRRGVPMRVVFEDPRRLVVTKPEEGPSPAGF